jgi:hydrogenase maturation factor HypF (carbamoyltransferase family)
LLGGRLVERLDRAGLGVYTHQTLSPGDDGLAVGQACTAAARLMKKGLT